MTSVLLTGGAGHLGNVIAGQLISAGYFVRCTVRDAESAAWLRRRVPNVECAIADVLQPDTLRSAMKGMQSVIHTAAAFKLNASDADKEILEPAIEGTRHVLEAAARAGAQRIVYTSSVAAVGSVARGATPLDERSWNRGAKHPYVIAKTQAELLAWQLAKEFKLDLVTICPGTILGPSFRQFSPSTQIFRTLMSGKMTAIPPMHFAYVDVRDVAQAHVMALQRAAAYGRYIVSGAELPLADFVAAVRRARPELNLPERHVPGWLFKLMLRAAELRKGGQYGATEESLLREFCDTEQRFNTSRARDELDFKPCPIEGTVHDTLDWLESPAGPKVEALVPA